jgi:hypothetical protein
VKVGTVLLTRINTPRNEFDSFVEEIDKRSVSAMLTLENYDVQETRRLAREEERQRADDAERCLKTMINAFIGKGSTVSEIANIMNVSEDYVIGMLPKQLA